MIFTSCLKVCEALRREKDVVETQRKNRLENKFKLIDRKPSNKVLPTLCLHLLIFRGILRKPINSRQSPSTINFIS